MAWRDLEKRDAYMRAYYLRNKAKVKAGADKWKAANIDKVKARQRNYSMKMYGITAQEKDDMIAHQGNLCAVCQGEFPSAKETHVDHCHETGKVRGVLCRHCNIGLGHFMDDTDRLQSAIDYLKRTA